MRTCEWCFASIDGKRRDARFCSDSCRYDAWAGNHADSRDNGFQRLRRPSRDGSGTRIYVTAEDFGPGRSLRPSAIRKLNAAAKRLERKEP